VKKSSAVLMPSLSMGWERCTCESIPPGITRWSVTSST
jgi:hypothetical protein